MPRAAPAPIPIELPPSPIDTPPPPEDAANKPHAVLLRLALGPWTVHFKSPGYIEEPTMKMLDEKCIRAIIDKTKSRADVREEIGFDMSIWKEIGELIDASVYSLERRCFHPPNPHDPEYDGLSGALIAQNHESLIKDLKRLHNVVLIARNVLVVGERVQNLCAKAQFDQDMFRLVNVCVKIAARGYDGEPGHPDQRKFDAVVEKFKEVLTCSLQFLNNLTARNERRKLMLWVELFDSTSDPVVDQIPPEHEVQPGDGYEQSLDEGFEAKFNNLFNSVAQGLMGSPVPSDGNAIKELSQPTSSPFLLFIGKTGMDVKHQLQEAGERAGAAEIAAECRRRWQSMSEEDKIRWDEFYRDLINRYHEGLAAPLASNQGSSSNGQDETAENVAALAKSIHHLRTEVEKMRKSIVAASKDSAEPEMVGPARMLPQTVQGLELQGYVPMNTQQPEPGSPKENDFQMEYTASYGADILQQGKDDLMKRLQHFSERAPPPTRQVASPLSPVASPVSPGTVHPNEAIEEGSEEEESEDEYDVIPGDDGRGLLTDVPLILAPGEIEVLPMIIQSGVVPPDEGQPGYGSSPEEITAIKNMHTVRCHLLLAQDNGRNLLRELLIFVAAWDLREEELYFKMMVKIMEAILGNALMPFSYHAFRESKDIISPAQAVIMKLLTSIFRMRQAEAHSKGTTQVTEEDSEEEEEENEDPNVFPAQVHVQMVKFLFTEFRRHIIPQTCALIFLQGQIRAGHASPEDFPLNLWDMERMYEGVYQYLEFFAILTEHEMWKKMMADWDVTSELVTLLKELDSAIPKGQLPSMRVEPPTAEQIRRSTEAAAAMARSISSGDINPSDLVQAAEQLRRNAEAAAARAAGNPAAPPDLVHEAEQLRRDAEAAAARAAAAKTTGMPPVATDLGSNAVERPYDVPQASQAGPSNAPLPNTAPPLNPLPPASQFVPSVNNFGTESPADEPSDFEWRNLKKLAVLVLSSLVWKSRSVQDQVRAHGGIEAILNCCAHDEHNPYIREHAIMCLRFLLEANQDNQNIIRSLEPRGVVPNEVTDRHGYETFMDARGHVGLRRKEQAQARASTAAATPPPPPPPPGATGPTLPPLTAQAAQAAAAGENAVQWKKMTPKDPKDLADMVQSMMRELPVMTRGQVAGASGSGSGAAKMDAEVLEKLDREFNGGG